MNKIVDLSIVILSWNTKDLLKQCLESIQIESENLNLEIIVVDNNSEDGSAEMVKATFSKVRIIKNEKNLGFSKGNNIGLENAFGKYILLLNSDTLIKGDALGKMMDFVKNNQNIIVSPLLLLPDGNPQSDYFMRFPNLAQIFLYHNPILRPLVTKTILYNLIASKISLKKSVVEVDQLPGAAILASKEIWDRVGNLDNDYQFFYEDVDWCYRAMKLNYKRCVLTEAKIIHFGGASWKKRLSINSSSFYNQFFSSMLLFVRKNYSFWQYLIFRFVIALNFILTVKPKLVWKFVTRGEEQNNTWL